MLARDYSTTIKALFKKEHYLAFFNMLRRYERFPENFWRYISGKGIYPYQPAIQTPAGKVRPTLYSFHDMLTVNEVFCRNDYRSGKDIHVVVDIESNIGIGALYFLTRNSQAVCYLFEPDPNNVVKLKKNLRGYENRYKLAVNAVSYEAGQLSFGVEPTGRYGGIGVKTGEMITVETLAINEVLKSILEKESRIDLLKMDIEGLELDTVKEIKEEYLLKIKIIYMEYTESESLPVLFPQIFRQQQRGSICSFYNKHL